MRELAICDSLLGTTASVANPNVSTLLKLVLYFPLKSVKLCRNIFNTLKIEHLGTQPVTYFFFPLSLRIPTIAHRSPSPEVNRERIKLIPVKLKDDLFSESVIFNFSPDEKLLTETWNYIATTISSMVGKAFI